MPRSDAAAVLESRLPAEASHVPAFGTMRLTGPGTWGPPADRGGAVRLLREAADRGLACFDTADAYGPGVTDELLAAAFGPRRSEITVIAKVGLERLDRNTWRPAGEPRALRAACERCLARLGDEHVDLLLLHTIDPGVPLEESVGALAELAAEGRAGGIGVCNVSAPELARASAVAEIAAVQNHLNLRDREHASLALACAAAGIRFFGWWPLRGGALVADDRIAALASHCEVSAAELALAWIHARAPAATPIVGFTDPAELGAALRARDLSLDEETLRALEEDPA